jgi:hypothetical protein
MKYISVEQTDRFTIKCIREDGKAVEVPIEAGAEYIYIEVAHLQEWQPPDHESAMTEADKDELRLFLQEAFLSRGKPVIFDNDAATDAQMAESLPFKIIRLNANLLQCERAGRTGLVSVAKSVDQKRLLVGVNKYEFWQTPALEPMLNDADFNILMRNLSDFLSDGTAQLEFQTEYRREDSAKPPSPAAPADDVDDDEEAD